MRNRILRRAIAIASIIFFCSSTAVQPLMAQECLAPKNDWSGKAEKQLAQLSMLAAKIVAAAEQNRDATLEDIRRVVVALFPVLRAQEISVSRMPGILLVEGENHELIIADGRDASLIAGTAIHNHAVRQIPGSGIRIILGQKQSALRFLEQDAAHLLDVKAQPAEWTSLLAKHGAGDVLRMLARIHQQRRVDDGFLIRLAELLAESGPALKDKIVEYLDNRSAIIANPAELKSYMRMSRRETFVVGDTNFGGAASASNLQFVDASRWVQDAGQGKAVFTIDHHFEDPSLRWRTATALMIDTLQRFQDDPATLQRLRAAPFLTTPNLDPDSMLSHYVLKHWGESQVQNNLDLIRAATMHSDFTFLVLDEWEKNPDKHFVAKIRALVRVLYGLEEILVHSPPNKRGAMGIVEADDLMGEILRSVGRFEGLAEKGNLHGSALAPFDDLYQINEAYLHSSETMLQKAVEEGRILLRPGGVVTVRFLEGENVYNPTVIDFLKGRKEFADARVLVSQKPKQQEGRNAYTITLFPPRNLQQTINIQTLFQMLNALEGIKQGWGGRASAGGSDYALGSTLTLESVAKMTQDFLSGAMQIPAPVVSQPPSSALEIVQPVPSPVARQGSFTWMDSALFGATIVVVAGAFLSFAHRAFPVGVLSPESLESWVRGGVATLLPPQLLLMGTVLSAVILAAFHGLMYLADLLGESAKTVMIFTRYPNLASELLQIAIAGSATGIVGFSFAGILAPTLVIAAAIGGFSVLAGGFFAADMLRHSGSDSSLYRLSMDLAGIWNSLGEQGRMVLERLQRLPAVLAQQREELLRQSLQMDWFLRRYAHFEYGDPVTTHYLYDPSIDALRSLANFSVTFPRIPGTAVFAPPSQGGVPARQFLMQLLSLISAKPPRDVDLNLQTKMPPGISDFLCLDDAWDAKNLTWRQARRLRLPESEWQLLQALDSMIQWGHQADLVKTLADWARLSDGSPLKKQMIRQIAAAEAEFSKQYPEKLPGLEGKIEDVEMGLQGMGDELLGNNLAPDVSAYRWLKKRFEMEGVDKRRVAHLTNLLARLEAGVLDSSEENRLLGPLMAENFEKLTAAKSSQNAVLRLYDIRQGKDFPQTVARAAVADRVSRVLAKAFLDHPVPENLPKEIRELAALLLVKHIPADTASLRRNLDTLEKLNLLDMDHVAPLLHYPVGWISAEVMLRFADKRIPGFFMLWDTALSHRSPEVKGAALEVFYRSMRKGKSDLVEPSEHADLWGQQSIVMYHRAVLEFLRDGREQERKMAIEEIGAQPHIFWNAQDVFELIRIHQQMRREPALSDISDRLLKLIVSRIALPQREEAALLERIKEGKDGTVPLTEYRSLKSLQKFADVLMYNMTETRMAPTEQLGQSKFLVWMLDQTDEYVRHALFQELEENHPDAPLFYALGHGKSLDTIAAICRRELDAKRGSGNYHMEAEILANAMRDIENIFRQPFAAGSTDVQPAAESLLATEASL